MHKFVQLSILIIFLLSSTSDLFGQYARLTFYGDADEALLIRANGKDLASEPASRLTVRVNHGNKYEIQVFLPGNAEPVVEKSLRINPSLISSNYILKQNKKGEYALKARNTQMEAAATETSDSKKGGGITYEYEMTETSAGPDGVTSKSSKGSGTLDGNGLNSRSTTTNASMDDKGFNMDSKTKETSTDALGAINALGKLGKSAKKKKAAKAAMDGRDLVVEELILASGKTIAPAASSSPSNVSTNTTTPATPAAAAVEIESVGGELGIGKVQADQGFEFYVLSEPMRAYKVVFEVETGAMTKEMLMQKDRGLKNAMDSMIEEVRKKKEKKKYASVRVDALITVEGNEAKAIAFTDNKGASMGRVHKYLDVELYIASTPTVEHEVVFEFTNEKVMVGKPDIEGRTKRTIKRIRKENPDLKFDGIVSGNGIQYQCIQFK